MLILTRRERGAVRIGTDIRITVERIDGDRVRLGFVAPREVRIVREELIDREHQAERRDA